MVAIAEIKKGAMKLANDLEGVIPINQKINTEFNKLIGEIEMVFSGSSSEEVKSVSAGIKETLTKLEQEKSAMMSAVIDIQNLANRL